MEASEWVIYRLIICCQPWSNLKRTDKLGIEACHRRILKIFFFFQKWEKIPLLLNFCNGVRLSYFVLIERETSDQTF